MAIISIKTSSRDNSQSLESLSLVHFILLENSNLHFEFECIVNDIRSTFEDRLLNSPGLL